jgi:Exostosin family
MVPARHRNIRSNTSDKTSNTSNVQHSFPETPTSATQNCCGSRSLMHCLGWLLIMRLAIRGFYKSTGLYYSYVQVEPPIHSQTIFDFAKAEGKIYFNDATMNLRESIDRHWLRYQHSGSSKEKDKPKLRLILTDFGWNHPNATTGLKAFRLKRSSELLQAFIDHPYFDPTFRFTEMASTRTAASIYDSSVTNIVMLDLETCFESNYPKYGKRDPMTANTDTRGGRSYREGNDPCFGWNSCSGFINKVLESQLFQMSPSSTIIFIDCGAEGYFMSRFPASLRRTIQTTPQISFASISATYDMIGKETDMGLPPPAVNPVMLSDEEQHDIATCQADTSPTKRNFFFSFVGTDRNPLDHGVRNALFELNQIDQGILLMQPSSFEEKFKGNHTFASVVSASKFAAAPRGDCMFSYRFTEVLSAGAIPVVHSDGWVLPFRNELVNWTKCAVVISEVDTPKTIEILRNITDQERCQMRRECYLIYQKYMATAEKNMAGLVDSVLARNAARLVHGTVA